MSVGEQEVVDRDVLDRLRQYVRVQVRTGIHDEAVLRELAIEACRTEIPDGDGEDVGVVADRLTSEEVRDWRHEATGWIGRTDPERLDAALARLETDGVRTLPGLTDPDALAQQLSLSDGTGPAALGGAVAYLVPDIWVALDTGRLRLIVRGPDGRAVGGRSALTTQIIDALADEGLVASADPDPDPDRDPDPGPGQDGDVLVTLRWRRRPTR